MKIKDFEALFPLKAMVTQEIIDNANIMDTRNCIGALTLKSVLPKYTDSLEWGAISGNIITDEGIVHISTFKLVDMMMVKEPQEVTFVLI